jgi:hypothetical protein
MFLARLRARAASANFSLAGADGGCETRTRLRVTGMRGAALSTYGFLCIAVALAVSPTQPAFALDPRYPDWPCRQLKVPEISIASVWTGPSIEALDKEQPADPKQADLVARLAARRTSMDDARKLIADYVTGTNEEKQEKAKTLFAALYLTLNAQRDQVMNGIERFSRKQKAMAAEIRDRTQKMRAMQDAPNADPAQSNELASQLSWQTRIFEDRQKSTSYVCDVPVLIEKRLFDLGSAIQDCLNAGSQAK